MGYTCEVNIKSTLTYLQLEKYEITMEMRRILLKK